MENLEAVKAVQRMQDYIENHLESKITLSDLAKAAGYSQWHCGRTFKELTGKPPFEYIRALRLSKAAILLRDEKPKIIDVVFDFVFDSHEGFARAFSKQFGISPKKYSCNPEPIKLFMPQRILEYYNTLKKGNFKMSENKNAKTTRTVFVQVVQRPKRKIMLKRAVGAKDYFEYCNEVGCEVWGMLCSVKEAIHEPAGMWLPKGMIEPGTSKYAQGVEVPADYSGKVPEGFDIIGIEPCKMMVFQGEPFEDEDFIDAIEELRGIIAKYDPKLYGFEWADDEAPRYQLEPQGYRGYIEARPVREISR